MLDWQRHRKLRIFIKAICIVLIVSFLSYDLTWAGAAEVLSPRNWHSSQETYSSPSIEIPQELGTIKESYLSKYNPHKLVIHIQDAHANVEAQENEAKLIKYLKDKYDLNLVSVEGGFGDFDAKFFRSFPKDKKVRDKIAKYFLSKAFISGTDYLLVTEDNPPAVYGAEDKELYTAHLNTFRKNQDILDSFNKSLSSIESVIETLKDKYYSKDLKELDTKVNDFRLGRISLEEYLFYLNICSIIHKVDPSEFPNFYSLITSQELEHKINFGKAETERQALIENLTKALAKADLEGLVKNSLAFKANELTPVEYYLYLEKLTQKAGIESSQYSNLFAYIKYITLSEGLDNSKVFEEIEEFTQKLKEKLAATQVQRDIDNLTYIIRILKGLSNINLSPKEYEYFKKTRDEFNQRRLAQLFGGYLDVSYIKSLPSDEDIVALEKFYDLAHERDKAIVSNSLNRLNREYSSNSVILVAGGFHTQGITSILKEKDISYLVIAPNIKQSQDKENVYFSLLKDKKLPLQDVLNDPDTLQIINSISDTQARQLLITYWVARASRYYSPKELQSQLDKLNLSHDDQNAVQLTLKEIPLEIKFVKTEELAEIKASSPITEANVQQEAEIKKQFKSVIKNDKVAFSFLPAVAYISHIAAPLVISLVILGSFLIIYRHQIIEFTRRIRAPDKFSAISNALCRTQKTLPVNFKGLKEGHPLKISLDKKELDKFLDSLAQLQRRQLFNKIDNLAQKLGFENLNVNSRYVFIKLLTCGDPEFVKSSVSFNHFTKNRLLEMFEKQKVITFAEIAKHILLPIVEKEGYSKFNNAVPMANVPRVLLISSYMRKDIRTGLFVAPHLGLYRIASFLELFGIQADVYDVDLSGEKMLENKVKEGQYDFIGFEVLHPTLRNNLGLIYKIHKLSPHSKLIAGGQGATFNYSLLFEKTPVDIVVRGYGEFPLLDMIVGFDKEKLVDEQFNQIGGIYLKSKEGKIISTEFVPAYSLEDLRVASLGLDFAKIPYEEYWQAVERMYSGNHLKMMKGEVKVIRLYCESHCPIGCDFCSTTHFLDDAVGTKQKVRILSAKDIVLLLKRAIRDHPEVEAFYFNDDDFLISRQRIIDLCELIEKELKERDLKFICMSRADRVDFELLSKMRQAGFKIISYGIESFSEKILSDMGKKLKGGNGKVAEGAVRETFKAGIIPRINFIMFYPTTTIEDLRITIDKAVELINEGAPPTYYNYVEPYPGASILSKGYEMKYEEFEIEGNKFRIPVEIPPVNKEIRELAKEAIRLKPQILRQIKNEYNWAHSTLPSTIDTLAFFYAIYKTASISTTRIEEVIGKFMKMDNSPPEDQKSKYTAENIEVAIEALRGLEYKTKEAIDIANQILVSNKKASKPVIQEAVRALKNAIEEIEKSLEAGSLNNFDEMIFEDLPQENAFGEPKEHVLPRLIYKSLLPTLSYAKKELEVILERQDVKIKSLLLVNGNRKLQVGSREFELVKAKGWQGWIIKDMATAKKYVYKDLVIEEVPGILSGLAQDLKITQNIMRERGATIGKAFEQARKRRAAIIERSVNLYEGWAPEERAFKTLRSRYLLPLLTTSLISLAALVGFGYFIAGGLFFPPLRIVDTAISWTLIGILAYLAYLSIYGLFSESGRFKVYKDDLIKAIPKNILLGVLSQKTKQKLEISDDTLLSNKEIIDVLNKDEFLNLISNPIANISLLVNNLPRKKLLDIALKLGINIDEIPKKEIASRVLKIAIDLFQRSKELNDNEHRILQEIFPQQAIIIPAVNDPNVIELVSQKIASVNYPNVIFFLALEERDRRTLEIVQKAQEEGKLPFNVIPYFGPVLGPNEPGKQHKPLSKPKTVNNILAQIQAITEGLIEDPPIKLSKLPDFMMIWDLEDDPAELQIWSMLIADLMIKSTFEDLIARMETDKGFNPDRIKPRLLKTDDPELYKQALRWGIDLNLPAKLKKAYLTAFKQIENRDSDLKEKPLRLVMRMGIKSDLNSLKQVERGYEEISFIQKRNHQYDPDPKKLMENYGKILEELSHKYSSSEQFVLSEFERRTIPANYQGILIIKMFGENPLSPLEWVLWFKLILRGLAAYRYDVVIFPLMVLGACLGYGFLHFYGAIGGLILGGLTGVILGRIVLSLGIDLRNKISLAFSAGTTNNFHFPILIYQLSAYPEYNVAEDWAIALKMAKMKSRTLLVDTYKTPTYEESLPQLGLRARSSIRWWTQHSRWLGGHFQSIPQILHKPFESIKEFGPINFMHSFILVIALSLNSLLFGYVFLRTFCWLAILGISTLAQFFNIPSVFEVTQNILSQLHNLFWWLPINPVLGLSLFILGPTVVISLGIFAILKERPDEEELVDKSIADLKRIAEEFRNRNNSDIGAVLRGVQDLYNIADELEAEGSNKTLLEIAESLEQGRDINIPAKEIAVRSLWQNSKLRPALVRKLRILAKRQKPWEELRNTANKIKEELDKEIQIEVTKLESKIAQIEQGRLFLGLFSIKIGKIRYTRLKKIIMNFAMPFYYLHMLPATILYFSQIYKGMDSQWRQTLHRTYGERYIKIVGDILNKEIYNNKDRGGQSMRTRISKFILVFLVLVNAGTGIGWTKDVPIEKSSTSISQAETQQLTKHAIDESAFIKQEKLSIHNVAANASKIAQFQALEVTINLSATYNNPFDAGDINLEGHFISPQGEQVIVSGFFYQDYIRDRVGNTERLTLQGNPSFKVRFSSMEKGEWKYYITVRDRTGEVKSDTQVFEIAEGTNPGYIRQSKQNNYLEFDSGKPFFAVGESIGWANRNSQTYDYDYYFTKLAENKCNYSRIWMVPWNLGLEWTNKGWPKGKFFGLGKYCLENAWRMDYILKLAEEKGIYILFTLDTYGDLMQEQGVWNEQMWENNPYNIANGGPCEKPGDFFTNEQAKSYYKERLRYIIARWGDSPNILGWELFNEVKAPPQWVSEMAKFIKEVDKNRHCVTISLGYPFQDEFDESKIWQIPEIDFTQIHLYGYQGKPQDLITELITKINAQTETYKKPCLVPEFGMDSSKDDRYYDEKGLGVNLHNGLWAATMSGAFGGAVNWWWDSYIEPNNLYYQYKALANFVEDINWAKNWSTLKVAFPEASFSNKENGILNKVRILGLNTNDEAILWIQNKESNWYSNYQGFQPALLKDISFSILGLSDGEYRLEWWDTWKGEVVQQTKAFSTNGKLMIEVPQVERDLAIKINRVYDESESKLQSILSDPFAKAILSTDKENKIVLNAQAATAINTLSATGLTLEIDADTLIDTSKGIPQLKGYGFKEIMKALCSAQQNKDISEDLRIRIINLNPALNKTKIIKIMGFSDELLKELVVIPDIPSDFIAKGLESYLINGSIRIVFEDNVKYWGGKVDVLVKRGKESEVISSLGLVVAALAKEPKFYSELPQEFKEYITANTDEKGNIALDGQEKIKQLIFRPMEKTKMGIQYLDRLNKANKELEGMV